MWMCYLKISQAFKDNNLENHVKNLNCELINNKTGFKIWIEDWVVFFNEYGTGIYNSNGVNTKEAWTYYKDGEFFTTRGQKPKFIFRDFEKEFNRMAKGVYSTAISYAIDQKSYNAFKNSL